MRMTAVEVRCKSCGEPNPPGARFCSSCGAALGEAAPPLEERKLVSVLFVDLVDSTARADKADPEDVRDVTREFMEHNKYTFPVVIDHDQVAVEAYNVSGFPTMYVVDKSGNIRYRNIGVLDGIEMIVQDQIDSLME